MMSKQIPTDLANQSIEFIEVSARKPEGLLEPISKLGFGGAPVYNVRPITVFQHNGVKILLNASNNSHSAAYAEKHGPGVSALGIRVNDADKAWQAAVANGAQPVQRGDDLDFPSIHSVGDSLICFVDDNYLASLPPAANRNNHDIYTHIDHLAVNVHKGHLSRTVAFFKEVLGYTDLNRFEITGNYTAFRIHALCSQCGNVRIPLNESFEDNSQIEEFLKNHNGEGIQHVAFACHDIYQAVDALTSQVRFMPTPDTYYDQLKDRIPEFAESIEALKQRQILIDSDESGKLFQIFTDVMLGPVFFELIQREGNQGFGEGNIEALFGSVEKEQIRRGVLSETM